MSRELVDSGIDWIGEIPVNWRLKRIGNYFAQRNEKVSDIDYQPLSVTKNGVVKQLETAAKSNDHNNRKRVSVNDFVINSRSDRKMSSGVSPLEGSVSLINIVLYSDKMVPSYVNYLLKNYGFAEEFYRWGTGIVEDLWSTNYGRMKKILIPIPSLEEQRKIANFLDDKVSNIDSIIENTKQSIEELKKYKQSLITETVTKGLNPDVEMKDSGIEWIKAIPEHWKLNYLNQYFTEHKFKNKGMEEKNLLSLSYGKIIQKDINIKDGLLPQSFDGYNIVDHGDIVLRLTDLQNDKKSLRVGLVTQRGIITSAYITLRKMNNINTSYVYYYLHTFDIHKGFYGLGSGVRQSLNYDGLKKLKILYPPLVEQQEIVNFLDKKTVQIDKLIDKKEKLIDEMESYKKSLIYEYVTGKKEVM